MNEPANFGTNVEGGSPWTLKCPYNKWDNPPYPTQASRIPPNQSKRLR